MSTKQGPQTFLAYSRTAYCVHCVLRTAYCDFHPDPCSGMAKNHVCRPCAELLCRSRPLFQADPRRTHLRPMCDLNENLSSRFCARGASVTRWRARAEVREGGPIVLRYGKLILWNLGVTLRGDYGTFFFWAHQIRWARLPLHWTTELERPVQTRLAGLSRDDHFRYMKQSCEFILIGYSIKFWNTFTTVSFTMLWSKFVLGCMTQIILPWGTDKHVLIKNVHKITGGSPNSTRLGPHKALLFYQVYNSYFVTFGAIPVLYYPGNFYNLKEQLVWKTSFSKREVL